MRRDPANVLDTEFCQRLTAALAGGAADDGVDALVLTGRDRVFSAGVDLFRVLEEDESYVGGFLAALDALFDAARTVDRPLVAAVNGHAIAGGAVLAFACDFRIMATDGATIGVPELRVGVPFPPRALDTVRAAVPDRALREAVLLGRIYRAEEAERAGLVDGTAPPGEVLDRAVALARDLGSMPAPAYTITRRALDRGADGPAPASVEEAWRAPETRDRIRAYLERTLGRSSR